MLYMRLWVYTSPNKNRTFSKVFFGIGRVRGLRLKDEASKFIIKKSGRFSSNPKAKRIATHINSESEKYDSFYTPYVNQAP